MSELKRRLETLLGRFAFVEPLVAMYIKFTPIVAVDKLKTSVEADTERIYVDKMRLAEGKVNMFDLAHAALHMIMLHPTRIQRYAKGDRRRLEAAVAAAEIMASIVMRQMQVGTTFAREYEEHMRKELDVDTVARKMNVNVEELAKMSLEELADLILKRSPDVVQTQMLQGAQCPLHGKCDSRGGHGDKNVDEDSDRKLITGQSGKSGQEASKSSGKDKEEGDEEEHGEENVEEESDKASGEDKEKSGTCNCASRCGLRLSTRKEDDKEGEVVNEGEDEGMEGDVERRLAFRVLRAYMAVKQAGRAPAWAQRLVEELSKPKVHWRRLLRMAMSQYLTSDVRATWGRTNRKGDMWPGKVTLGRGKAIVLVDASGSIGEREISQFLGEIYAIAREQFNVVVVPWDVEVYEATEIKSPSDVRKVKVYGGGGTQILEALKYADKIRRHEDEVIILSDWAIGDIDVPEVQRLLKKLDPIAVTTDVSPPPFIRRRVKIEL